MSNIQNNFNSIISTLGILKSLAPNARDKYELKNIQKADSYIDTQVEKNYSDLTNKIRNLGDLDDNATTDEKIRHKQSQIAYGREYQEKLQYLRAKKMELIDRRFALGDTDMKPTKEREKIMADRKAKADAEMKKPLKERNNDFIDSYNDLNDTFNYVYSETENLDNFKGDEQKLKSLLKQKEDEAAAAEKTKTEAAAEVKEPLEPQKEIEPNPSQAAQDYITKNMNLGQSYEAQYRDYANKMESINKKDLEDFYKEKDAFDKGYYSIQQKEKAERLAQLEYIKKLETMYGQQDSMEQRVTYLKSIHQNREGQQAREDIKNKSFFMGGKQK